MDEQHNNDNDHNKKRMHEMADKANWEQQFFEQVLHELKTEERYANYFKDFRPESVEQFMRYYASTKTQWYKYAKSQAHVRELKVTRWTKVAEQALLLIQDKKQGDFLMDWLSEKVTSPHMEIFADYTKYSDDPLNSPLVPPVSEAELNLFLDFYDRLESTDGDEEDEDANFVNVPFSFTNLSRLMSDWNDFVNKHNGKTGNKAPEYSTPRITKQTFYINLALAKQKADEETKQKENKSFDAPAAPPAPVPPTVAPVVAAQPAKPYVPDHRPYLHTIKYNEHRYARFIEKFDSRETLKYYKVMRRVKMEREFLEQVQDDLWKLEEAKEFVPIGSDDDWREAVKAASEAYAQKKVRQAIVDLWNMYCINMQAQKPYTYITERKKFFDPFSRERTAALIIQGRVLNGEPPDLNY